jgi:hypothetical protein
MVTLRPKTKVAVTWRVGDPVAVLDLRDHPTVPQKKRLEIYWDVDKGEFVSRLVTNKKLPDKSWLIALERDKSDLINGIESKEINGTKIYLESGKKPEMDHYASPYQKTHKLGGWPVWGQSMEWDDNPQNQLLVFLDDSGESLDEYAYPWDGDDAKLDVWLEPNGIVKTDWAMA